MAGEPGHCRARIRPPWWSARGVLPSKCPSIAAAEISNTPRWNFGPLEDNQRGGCRLHPKKSRRELFHRIFAFGIFWSWVSRYTSTPLIVALSPGHSDINRFRPRSSIAPNRKSFGSRRKNSKFAQTTGSVDVFDPRSGISGPTSRGASASPNLYEWWTQPVHVRCPVAQFLI